MPKKAPKPLYNGFTIVLPLFNEERSVSRLIDYYQGFAELLIVDNFSNDRTKEIAVSKGINVFQLKNSGSADDPEWFKAVFENVKTNYIFLTSSSYFIKSNLFSLANKVALEKKFGLIDFPIASYTDGIDNTFYNKLVTKKNRRVQLFFDKNKLNITEIKIHNPYTLMSKSDEILVLDDVVEKTICQLRTSSTKSLIVKTYAYAQVEALQSFERGEKWTIRKLLLKELKELLRIINTPLHKLKYVWFRELWMRLFYNALVYFLWKDIALKKDENASYETNLSLWDRLRSQDLN